VEFLLPHFLDLALVTRTLTPRALAARSPSSLYTDYSNHSHAFAKGWPTRLCDDDNAESSGK
jgi:hypothetical protein